MLSARIVSLEDVDGALRGALAAALALPPAAREYLEDRLPVFHLVLEGLSPGDARALKDLRERQAVPGVALYPQLLFGDRERAPGRALLSGRLEQIDRLVRELGEGALGQALRRALEARGGDRRARLWVGGAPLPAWTAVMGVVNVTPDSFSDGGRFLAPEAAVEHGLALVAQGALLLDVGGESTRPGGGAYGAGMAEVSAEEERARVVPVIRVLAQKTRVPISVDTRKAEVARAALEAGASMVNDVSGLRDPAMAPLVAERGASLCVMHSKGELRTMQVAPSYGDVVGEVARFLAEAAAKAVNVGVPPERICIDPGIGFGKTYEHNLALLRSLPALAALGYPVLVGASRKAFIGKLTGRAVPAERQLGSVAAAVGAAMRGASLVRVHDVAATVEALAVCDAVLSAPGLPVTP